MAWQLTILGWLNYIFIQAIYNIYFHPLSKVLGPCTWSASRLPFVWSLINGNMIRDTEELHCKYGCVLRIAPDEAIFAREDAWNGISAVRQSLQLFLKDTLWWAAQPGIPQSILSAIDPKERAVICRVLAPRFTTGALKEQEPVLHFYVNLLIERLLEIVDKAAQDVGNAAAKVGILSWTNFICFDIFGDLGFGESFDCLQCSQSSPFFNDKRHADQPFSVDPRACMGQHLARAEMRLILTKLGWKFHL
ncbi:Cytochrome P450 monooxygenase lcsI [Cladobotryum mycophilum]|uniref:Cytochrome P450 monooxygenase lcsI n=1 Tax=Cladobotryum mycophilum TaxID=491253 RepID=A0ABR0S4A9_9HYPO